MTIQPVKDDFDNLTGTITTFLGYRPDTSDLQQFPYQIYKFLIARMRLIDEVLGTKFYKRFLDGPQEVWSRIDKRALDLLNIFDPALVDARYLPSLRKYVGFGDDMLDVVNAASEDELRIIVEGGIEFWRNRMLRYGGPSTAVDLVTGNRFKIRGYHEFKFILGETWIFEELENLDPFMIDVETVNRFRRADDGETQFGADPKRFSSASGVFAPEDVGAFIVIQDDDTPGNNGFYRIDTYVSTTEVGIESSFPSAATGLTWFTAFEYDEYITEIRLVDDLTGDGAINRDLLRRLLEWTRPHSERFNIVYVSFMDLFTTANDLGQWGVQGTDDFSRSVADGVMTLTGDPSASGSLVTDYYNDDTWKNYSLKSKVVQTATGTWQILFLITDEDNHYYVEVHYQTPTKGTVELYRRVAGVPTQLGSTYIFPIASILDIPYTYTIDVFRNEATSMTSIDVRLDSESIISVLDSNFDTGRFGYRVTSGTVIDVDEVELWQYPLTIDRVGPNP